MTPSTTKTRTIEASTKVRPMLRAVVCAARSHSSCTVPLTRSMKLGCFSSCGGAVGGGEDGDDGNRRAGAESRILNVGAGMAILVGYAR